MKILEYKMDANDNGNEIVPSFINHSDCGYFYNPADFSYVGIGLSERVYVPDSVTELDKASLKTRCHTAGIMMSGETQMTNEEIDAVIDSFCDSRGIS